MSPQTMPKSDEGIISECPQKGWIHELRGRRHGAIQGNRVAGLEVERFEQEGTMTGLYSDSGIDRQAIIAAAGALAPGKPLPLERGVA